MKKDEDVPDRYADVIEKHVGSIGWIREELLGMDSMINPVMGIGSWDDSVIIDFGKKRLVASVDGPYKKRLVMKSALIHCATDVVVKGARPLFALDTVTGNEEDVREMILSLKMQACAMSIPILGGNTMIEDTEPKCSLTVIGELLLDEPIRDSGAKKGDVLALIGEPLWGSQEERIEKAKRMFDSWFKIIENASVHASKDVTKGGLVSAVYEISKKSGRKFELMEDIPFSMTRNLDNFLVSVSVKDYDEIEKICSKNSCPVRRIGKII